MPRYAMLFKLIDYFKLQFMHRYITREIPSSFDNLWPRNEERRRPLEHSLRNTNDFFVPPTRLVSTDSFPLVLFPRLWNNFDDALIKNIVSKTEFNFKLKCYFLKDLSENYKCNRLLCPNCHLFLLQFVSVTFCLISLFGSSCVFLSKFIYFYNYFLHLCLSKLCSTIWCPDCPPACWCRSPARWFSCPACASVPPSPYTCDRAKLRVVTPSPTERQVLQMKTA